MNINSDDIDIFERFDDVSGEMLFAIKVIYSRRIMAEGVKIANESLIESVIIGVVLLIGIWIGGRILILNPLQRMTNYVRDYKENRISKKSLIVNRNDEIGLLSRAYDQMLTRIQTQRTQLEVLNQELEVISRTDSLTKLSNRRSFDEILDKELLILRRQHKEKHVQGCLSLLVCDIDYFKQYNDTYGHQAGDQVLTEVAGALMNSIRRPADFVCRYGGEEFAILLPDTTEQGARYVAEMIVDEVNRLNIEHKASKISSHITISVGGSCILADTDLDQLSLFSRADNALYTAKQKGRNRIDFISCENH
jgi:diguanylate cyclase (GGDEF)-like protein